MTVVWICDPNYHKILPTLALNFSKNYWSFEKPYHIKHSKVCFIRYLNTSKSLTHKTALTLISLESRTVSSYQGANQDIWKILSHIEAHPYGILLITTTRRQRRPRTLTISESGSALRTFLKILSLTAHLHQPHDINNRILSTINYYHTWHILM